MVQLKSVKNNKLTEMRNFFIVIFTILLYSCSSSDKNTTSIDIDLSQKSSNIDMMQVVKDIRPIKLNTNEEIIGSIDKLVWADDCLVLVDKQQETIFVFNENGELKSKIHRQGRGPQEYLTIGDATYYNGLIAVYDGASYQICYYDIEGNFIQKHDGCEGYQLVSEGENVIVYAGSDADHYELHIFNQEGIEQGVYMPVDKVLNSLPTTFVNNLNMTKYEDEVLVMRYFDYNIYSLQNEQLKVKYSFSFGKDNFDQRLITESNPVEFHRDIIKDKSVHTIDYFIESKNWLSFQAGTQTILYRKKDGDYIVNEAMPALYKVLFLQPAIACRDNSYVIPMSASNLKNAIIPLLKNSPTGITAFDNLVNENVSEYDNPWLMFVQLN